LYSDNKQMLRVENPDIVYRTEKEKYFAAADEISNWQRRPAVLVGTTSVANSRASQIFLREGHQARRY